MAQSKKRKISPDTNIRADNLNVSDLIKVCKFIGLSRISGLRKIELLYLIDVAIRETGGPIYIDSLEGYLLPPVYINEHDPISMESLTTRKPCHIFTLDNNFDEPRHVHRFDPVSMVTMIVSTASRTRSHGNQCRTKTYVAWNLLIFLVSDAFLLHQWICTCS